MAGIVTLALRWGSWVEKLPAKRAMRRDSDTRMRNEGSWALGEDEPYRSLKGAQEVDGRGPAFKAARGKSGLWAG